MTYKFTTPINVDIEKEKKAAEVRLSIEQFTSRIDNSLSLINLTYREIVNKAKLSGFEISLESFSYDAFWLRFDVVAEANRDLANSRSLRLKGSDDQALEILKTTFKTVSTTSSRMSGIRAEVFR